MNWAIEKKGYLQRRACGLVGMAPRVYRYASRRGDDEGDRVRLRELAAIRRRFGYRRLHILLKREGVVVNHKKLYRIYREERLTVRKRGGRKRALGTRAPMAIPQGRNQRWSLDFVSDTLVDGRRFRVLVVVDDFTRECLTLLVDTSLSGVRVARELDRLVALRGRPAMIVSDNGTEFTSHAHAALVGDEPRRVALHRSRQADAERLRREPQRALPRRVPERDTVPWAGPRSPRHRGVENRLQHRTTPHEPRRARPERVCCTIPRGSEPERILVMNGDNPGARSRSTANFADGRSPASGICCSRC